MEESVTFERFGKDHWSMLAYIETCCINSKDSIGCIDYRRIRVNSNRHPLLATRPGWEDSYGTITNDGIIIWHDDVDCMNDLEDEGFIEVMSLINGAVLLTPLGGSMCKRLRDYKASGGKYNDFVGDKNDGKM